MNENEKNEIIESFSHTYKRFHNVYPKIKFSGAWIYINNCPKAYRISDLPKLELDLLRYDFHHIDLDILNSFVNELFVSCGYSTFQTEEFLKNYQYDNVLVEDDGGNIVVDSNIVKKLEQALDEIDIKNREIEDVKNLCEVLKKNLKIEKEASKKLDKKHQALKENAVLFSMDDLEDIVVIEKNDEEDKWNDDEEDKWNTYYTSDDIPF